MRNIRKPILYTALGALIVLAVVGGKSLISNQLLKSDVKGLKSEAVTPTPIVTIIPTSTPIPTNAPTTKPQVIYEPIPTSLPTNAPIPTQPPQAQAPAISIELCKTKAETYKTQTETAMVLVYNQQNPEVVEFANASTLGEIKTIAIKYGKYQEGDFDSNPTLTENYFNYLHNWALEQIQNYMAVVEGKGQLAYNDYYTRCLNGEN